MVNLICKLQKMGAEYIMISCSIAHYLVPYTQLEIYLPILNMVNLTGRWMDQ